MSLRRPEEILLRAQNEIHSAYCAFCRSLPSQQRRPSFHLVAGQLSLRNRWISRQELPVTLASARQMLFCLPWFLKRRCHIIKITIHMLHTHDLLIHNKNEAWIAPLTG